MRRRLAWLLVAALVAVPAVTVAIAQSGIRDRDDSAGAVDLRGARAAHNRVSDELVWVIDVHERFRPAQLLADDGPPGSICVNAWTRRRPGEAPPDYDACITPDARGRELQASVARHGVTGTVRRVGAAEVERPARRRVVLRVDPDLIRRPRALRWTVQAAVFSPDCPGTTGCEDFVPDRPDASRMRLRRPR